MYLERPVKIIGNKKSRRRLRTILQLICLLIAFFIYLSYSFRVVWAFLFLIILTLLRLRTISGEQYYVVDAMCKASREKDLLRLEICCDQPSLCRIHCASYRSIRVFDIDENGKVILEYQAAGEEAQWVTVRFCVHSQDQSDWEAFIQKPILYFENHTR